METKGITFKNLAEANEYESSKKKEGFITRREKVVGGWKVYKTGNDPKWENATEIKNVNDALKDE